MSIDSGTGRFSSLTCGLLRKAGWFEGRQVDTTAFCESILAQGLRPNDCAIAFLSEFGGLQVVHPHWKVQESNDLTVLDPEEAWGAIHPSYARRIGAPFCSIGSAHNFHMVLLMTDVGHVFAGYDQILQRVGLSGDDALEAICSGRPYDEVPEDAGAAGGPTASTTDPRNERGDEGGRSEGRS